MQFDNVVYCVDGGIGKNVLSTVPLRAIKKKYPDKKIIVICGYTEIFQHNPAVSRVYNFSQTQHIYEDYIKDSRSLILRKEPYIEYPYLYHQPNGHLTRVWCDLLGLEWDNPRGELFFTESELVSAREFIKSKGKPVLLMHLVGGAMPHKNKPTPKMYIRSLPQDTANKLVNKLKGSFHIMAIAGPTQPVPEGAERITTNLRAVMSLAWYADRLLLIDSFMQHVCAAIKKKAVVLWGGTSPKVLGYDFHTNLTQEVCPTPFCHRPNSYLFDVTPYGAPWECKYDEKCMKYDIDEIISHLDPPAPKKEAKKKECSGKCSPKKKRKKVK